MLGQPSQNTQEKTFVITELADGSRLECRALLREVPGRRRVCRGDWGGRAVIAKIFTGNQAARYAQRDADGVAALLAAGIPTPALLGRVALRMGGGEALVFEEIGNARDAEAIAAENPDGCFDLALKLVATLAAQHAAGLLQTDLYLKNFLLQGGTLYSLDGDGIRSMGKPLGKRRSLDHLAQLLSKFDVLPLQKWLPSLLTRYLSERQWMGDANVASLAAAVVRHRYATFVKYAERKVFRTCTDVQVERRWNQYLAVSRLCQGDALAQWQENPDRVLRPGQAQFLKQGRTCTVVSTQLGGETVVIKRYNIKGVAHGLSRALRPTRAARSWANAHRLRMASIATAAPLALLERRWGAVRREAYYVADYVDAPDAFEYFADAEIELARKQKAAVAIARLFHKLLALGISHGDCKATNFKVRDDAPVVLDLDSMRQHRTPQAARARHIRDLRRWLRNWPENSATRALLEQALNNEYEDTGLLQAAGLVITSKTT